ncbi:MAG: hypothetical protein Q7S22_06555 [Candidatus Micrarchaeota archaeon]|nr:hypothetical protein [Candidatus Micrarchaeota archaeon]
MIKKIKQGKEETKQNKDTEKRTQMFSSGSGNPTFSVILPKGWIDRMDEQVTEIYKVNENVDTNTEDIVGIMHVSTYGKNSLDPNSKKLSIHSKNFLKSLVKEYYKLDNIKIKECSKEGSDFSECEFISENEFWKLMHVRGKHRTAFVTYSCSEQLKDMEKKDVEIIFDSFRLD